VAGRYGREKTLDLVGINFVWPGMKKWIEEYVGACDVCQRNRRLQAKPVGEPVPLPPED
jgi:hypothetical protein